MALTRTVHRNETVVVGAAPRVVYSRIALALETVGKLRSEQPDLWRLTGSVRAGAMNGNKASISVVVSAVDAGSLATFALSAQEGLIDQDTCGRALTRVLDAAELPPVADAETRTCPYCAETIKAAAVVCRFCNRDL